MCLTVAVPGGYTGAMFSQAPLLRSIARRMIQPAVRPLAVERHQLPRGAACRISALGGARLVRCTAGELWLTRAGDPADYLLRPGETFRIAAGDDVVAQALEDAVFCVE